MVGLRDAWRFVEAHARVLGRYCGVRPTLLWTVPTSFLRLEYLQAGISVLRAPSHARGFNSPFFAFRKSWGFSALMPAGGDPVLAVTEQSPAQEIRGCHMSGLRPCHEQNHLAVSVLVRQWLSDRSCLWCWVLLRLQVGCSGPSCNCSLELLLYPSAAVKSEVIIMKTIISTL